MATYIPTIRHLHFFKILWIGSLLLGPIGCKKPSNKGKNKIELEPSPNKIEQIVRENSYQPQETEIIADGIKNEWVDNFDQEVDQVKQKLAAASEELDEMEEKIIAWELESIEEAIGTEEIKVGKNAAPSNLPYQPEPAPARPGEVKTNLLAAEKEKREIIHELRLEIKALEGQKKKANEAAKVASLKQEKEKPQLKHGGGTPEKVKNRKTIESKLTHLTKRIDQDKEKAKKIGTEIQALEKKLLQKEERRNYLQEHINQIDSELERIEGYNINLNHIIKQLTEQKEQEHIKDKPTAPNKIKNDIEKLKKAHKHNKQLQKRLRKEVYKTDDRITSITYFINEEKRKINRLKGKLAQVQAAQVAATADCNELELLYNQTI